MEYRKMQVLRSTINKGSRETGLKKGGAYLFVKKEGSTFIIENMNGIPISVPNGRRVLKTEEEYRNAVY